MVIVSPLSLALGISSFITFVLASAKHSGLQYRPGVVGQRGVDLAARQK